MPKIPGLQPGSMINQVRCGVAGAPLVVLVHAVGADLTYWGDQIEALAPAYDVIAYDLPGHGASTAPAPGFDFAFAADTLAAVIAQAEAGPAHVVGQSVGGMIAQTLALARPELVRSLVLIDSISTFTDPMRGALRDRARLARDQGMAAVVPQTLERWFTPGFMRRRPDMIDRVAKTLLVDDPAVHAGMWDMIAMLDVAPRLHEIAKPTLVLVGEQDPATPVAASRAIAERIPGAVLHVLPDASHMAPLEVPGLVNRLLVEFLAAC